MQGLLKGLWIILVIFMLSLLFGKRYKTSLVSKSLLQAAWYCWWFSLLFADRFFSTYTGRRQWNNFSSLSLWDLKLRSIFQKYITAKTIKNRMYVAKDLLNFATEENKTIQKSNQGQSACTCLYFSLSLSYATVVRMIVRTSSSRNHNCQADWDPTNSISSYNNLAQ